MNRITALSIGFVLLWAGLGRVSASDLPPTTRVAVEGPWGSLAVHGAAQRVYVVQGDRVKVLDFEGREVGEVTGIAGARTVGLAPELGIGFASSGRTHSVSVFCLATLEVEKRLRTTGEDPEAVLFDPASRRLFAFNAGGRNASAYDAFGGATAGSIPLGGRPGAAAADGLGRIFVNLEGAGELAVLDSRRLAVRNRWPVPRAEGPSCLALDPERGRLFLLTREGTLAVLDSANGKLLATLPAPAGAACLACDPDSGRVYVANPEGSLGIFKAVEAGGLALETTVPLGSPVRALVLDADTSRLYVAGSAAEQGARPGGAKLEAFGRGGGFEKAK